MTISIAEFLAVEDVLRDTCEESESLRPDEALDIMLAIDKMIASARVAKSFLERQITRTLEGTLVRDGYEYTVRSNGHWVYDHDTVAREAALLAAQPDENGVVPTAHRAAAEAARMVRQIYASPSTDAKVGKLAEFEIPLEKVRDWVGEDGKRISKKPTNHADTPRRE